MPAHVEFRLGSIFDVKCDLLVIPSSAEGTVTPGIEKDIRKAGLPLPGRMDWGSITLHTSKNPLFQTVAYAAVSGENASADVVDELGRELGRLAAVRGFKRISAPVLGAWPGNLPPPVAAAALRSGFVETAPESATLVINARGGNAFAEITKHLGEKKEEKKEIAPPGPGFLGRLLTPVRTHLLRSLQGTTLDPGEARAAMPAPGSLETGSTPPVSTAVHLAHAGTALPSADPPAGNPPATDPPTADVPEGASGLAAVAGVPTTDPTSDRNHQKVPASAGSGSTTPAPASLPAKRTRVFISYNHADAEWLERLQKHLKPLQREGVQVWDDTRLKPGEPWREEIRDALAATKVAILLISADFLASDFIVTDELPPLLRAAEEDGATILPVIISPSRFSRMESLSRFQAVNDPEKPLAQMRRVNRDKVLDKVAQAVEDALKR